MSKHKTEVLACLDMLRNPVDTRADAYRIAVCITTLYLEIECLCGAQDEIRAEAIKEFAERLKKSAFDCDVSFGYGVEHYTEAVAVVEIDNLVKEMTEGKQ